MSAIRTATKQLLRSAGLLEPLNRVRVVDWKKNSELIRAQARSIRHIVDEYFYRLPNPALAMKLAASTPCQMRPVVDELKRDGIVTLSGYVTGERLKHMRAAFDSMIRRIEAAPLSPEKLTPFGGRLHPRTAYREQGRSEEARTTFTNDPFKHDKAFLDFALAEFILGIVERYIRRRCMLQQGTASRYYPTPKNNFGSWQWHHDSWGTKVNVMVLLTDVGPADQYMSYMKRSHRIYHSYERTALNDRFTEAEVAAYKGLERIDCLGPAGTVFVFDANGFHRGNRSLGAGRDSLIVQYTAGRYLWPFEIRRQDLEGATDYQRAFLSRNPEITYM